MTRSFHNKPENLFFSKMERYLVGLDPVVLFKNKRVLGIGEEFPWLYPQLFLERYGAKTAVALNRSAEAFHQAPFQNTNPKLQFVVGDCCSLPFDAETFDIVFGSHILSKLKGLDQALKEVRRVLVPRGLYVGLEPSLRNPLHLLRQLFNIERNWTETRLLSVPAFRKAFRTSGFEADIQEILPRFGFLRYIGIMNLVRLKASKG